MKIQQNNGESTEAPKVEKSILFESKYVKQIIESFNNVLELVDQQEKELDEYVGRFGEIDDEEDDDQE